MNHRSPSKFSAHNGRLFSAGHPQKGSEPHVWTFRKEVRSQGRVGGDELTGEQVCLGDSVEAGVTAVYTLSFVAKSYEVVQEERGLGTWEESGDWRVKMIRHRCLARTLHSLGGSSPHMAFAWTLHGLCTISEPSTYGIPYRVLSSESLVH
jgi:hypothetical protein